ncbi:helix-turn-helix transcriptional regulator [Levilactobacillus mulengensis]|uniref:helix-turn-helix transcriptional regulator n=1 Tax=Levilactobacillus mulengensis TaxID=2486025 RepID=UPI000F77A5C9|nr:helix-turn-helix domain-containing protein [Levilactobacillus mulengensis]
MVKRYQHESTEPVAPGDSLQGAIDLLGISPEQLAQRTDTSFSYVTAVLAGTTRLTPAFAQRLSPITRVSAAFWLRYDDIYQRKLALKERVSDND